MTRVLFAAIFVVGIILVYFGWQEKQSLSSQVSQMVTNQPTDNTILFIIAGAVAIVIGLGGLFVTNKK
ncbi:DUF3185 family protein [Aliidiomarina quisquiliarum]|uniref:DUF3185 family protein n=1 Tax=Aliidiomarina quisquiliarum TaxID=2938947 RepID=UPI00208FF379|nr:DUF3185 family protein [Aliidiomarina quisquiliarum]MCO4320497.1 DUF3185 family protein [Aliidiomarina quisquiliarum]